MSSIPKGVLYSRKNKLKEENIKLKKFLREWLESQPHSLKITFIQKAEAKGINIYETH